MCKKGWHQGGREKGKYTIVLFLYHPWNGIVSLDGRLG